MADCNRFTRRAPKRNQGLSWGRYPTDDSSAVVYRIFRRDHTGRLHFEEHRFHTDAEPAHIARVLRSLKRQLRDRVDEIDLTAPRSQRLTISTPITAGAATRGPTRTSRATLAPAHWVPVHALPSPVATQSIMGCHCCASCTFAGSESSVLRSWLPAMARGCRMRNHDCYRNPALTCPSCGEKGDVQCTDVADARLHFFTDEEGCDVENTHHLGPRIADCHCRNCNSKWLMLEDTYNER